MGRGVNATGLCETQTQAGQGLFPSAPITHQKLPHCLPSLLSWAEVDLESLLSVHAAERRKLSKRGT